MRDDVLHSPDYGLACLPGVGIRGWVREVVGHMEVLTVALLLSLLTTISQPGDVLWIDLAAEGASHGLRVPSAGDGTLLADEVAGSPCMRIAPDSGYLYVDVDHERLPAQPLDLWVRVEFYDSHLGLIHFDYDRADGSAYSRAMDTIIMMGSGQWLSATVHLPDAAVSNRENHGTDFRFVASDVAVRRIEVLSAEPADYVQGGSDPSRFEELQTQIGEGMELTFGNDAGPGQALLYRALGVTSVESYVTWQTAEDDGEGEWDWSQWDQQVEVLEASGLKWVPFLIAGPAYANPKWFRESDMAHPYVCLEHGQPSKVESLWNPELPHWVDRYLGAFAERYRDRGVIESVLLGVTGIYGESIYPAGPEDGWTADIPGPYHNHMGYWAGDEYAIADFRAAMTERYGDIETLNDAWSTGYSGFDEVTTFLPADAPSPRARVDFTNWYLDAMTDWSVLWVELTRKHFPDTPIYLCTGGDENPQLGADFTAQAARIAPYGAGIRITNEGSNYAFNYVITREVSTATRAFDTFCGFEPASSVDPQGVVARIYNATASGARQLHYYSPNVLGLAESVRNYRTFAPHLQSRRPVVRAGLYVPKTTWALDDSRVGSFYNIAASIRDYVDFELLDALTLDSQRLPDVKVVGLVEAAHAEEREVEAMRAWVASGGVLVAVAPREGSLLSTPEGEVATGLFAELPADLDVIRYHPVGELPRRVAIDVGSPSDLGNLAGTWHSRETGPEWPAVQGATKRWSGADASVLLPIDASANAVLILDVNMSEHNADGANRVLVNGHEIGRLDRSGSHLYRFEVPQAALEGRQIAEIRLDVTTWVPLEHGMNDGRSLGAAVRWVELCSEGCEDLPIEPPFVRASLDLDLVRERCVRPLGEGATILLPPAAGDASDTIGLAMLAVLDGQLGPKGSSYGWPDGGRDGIFWTETTEEYLVLNTTDAPVTLRGVEIPAHGIAEVPR
jgi:hypothetical protein